VTPLDDDRPTLLLFGDGEPMLDALVAALSGRAIVMVEDEAESAVAAVLANVPDVTVFVGRAAEPEKAAALLRELGAHALTASSPVALLSSDDSLEARLRAAEHGVVTILQRSASADAMARQMLELATRLYDDPGVHEAGELAEASVDDLVQILGRELQSGILSITQADGARAERFVVRAGQPMRAAISQFIERVRPLIAEAKPLHYAFHEAPVAPLWTLDDEAEAEADGSARKGLRERRFLLIANNPAAADALAQELRANGALVVVVSADGSGWDRARDLDPEVALIDEEGLNHWGFDAVARLRADPQLRWASLVVMDAKELLPEDGPPRVERLAANIAKLTEPDAALRARAAAHEVFDARIETVGPTRLVRALLSTGGAWNLQVRPRGGATLQLALAEGLVAGASAHLPDGRRLEAAAAFACLLVAGAGRLRAEPATHPKLANMLMPLDEAVRAAHAEGSPMPVTHSPSAPPPPPERSSRPSSPPRARGMASQTHSTETNALVGELEDLVGGLQDALEGQPTRPKGVARVAAPKPPLRAASAPIPNAAATSPKPAPTNAAPMAPKPAPTTAAPTAQRPAPATAPKSAVGALAEPARAAAVPPRTPASPASAAGTRAAAASARPASAPVASPGKPSPLAGPKPGTARPAPPPSASPEVPARAAAAGTPPVGPAVRVAPARSAASTARPPAPAAAATSLAPPAALAAAKSLPPPPPPAALKSLPPPPPATRTSLPPPLSEDNKPTLPPLPGAGLAPQPQPPPTTRPPPPPTPAGALPDAPVAPRGAEPLPGAPAPRPVPMPQPPPVTLPAQPQPIEPQAVMAQPVISADAAPRRKVSPVHVVIALAIILAGTAGFALVFTFAAQTPASDPGSATPAPAPVAAPAPAPLPPAPAATAPAPVSRAQVDARAPSAPRLPSVDPGPMPEEHAGAAATVERYRESLARGARARSRGDLEVALSSYRFAAHLKPRSTDAALGIARTYLEAQQPADALRWAERARDVETRGIEGRLMVGDVLLAMGQHDQAIATWREAQTLAPRERAPEERIRRAEEDLAEED
jgi:DNA-binding NarL/FixJ family response regulator